MKKVLFFFLFCGFKFILKAQTPGLQINYFIQPQVTTIIFDRPEKSTNTNTSSNGNLYTGIGFAYFFNEMTGFGTGLSYGRDGEAITFVETVNQVPVRSYHYFYKFSFIKIPLLVKHFIKARKARLMFEGGPQLCYLLKAENSTYTGIKNYTDDYEKIQLNFQLGFGIGFRVLKNYQIYFKPNFELTSLIFHYSEANKDLNFPLGKNLSAFTFGLQVGVNRYFNKSKT